MLGLNKLPWIVLGALVLTAVFTLKFVLHQVERAAQLEESLRRSNAVVVEIRAERARAVSTMVRQQQAREAAVSRMQRAGSTRGVQLNGSRSECTGSSDCGVSSLSSSDYARLHSVVTAVNAEISAAGKLRRGSKKHP